MIANHVKIYERVEKAFFILTGIFQKALSEEICVQ